MMDRLLFFTFLRVKQAKLQQQLTGKRILIPAPALALADV
jgi:hypothetical protein